MNTHTARSDIHVRPLVVGKGRRRSCKKRRCRSEMVCGRFYVLRSVHSCFACVYSQIATKNIRYTKKYHHRSGSFRWDFIIQLYFSSEASRELTATASRMFKLFERKSSKKSIITCKILKHCIKVYRTYLSLFRNAAVYSLRNLGNLWLNLTAGALMGSNSCPTGTQTQGITLTMQTLWHLNYRATWASQ